MIIPLEFYDDIRHQIKPSEIIRQKVSLSKKGNEYLGLCPFHTEKTPSFTVNDIKRFYHCFGCSAHGDVIKFMVETTGLSYKDAAIKLARDNGIELPKITAVQEKKYEEAEKLHNFLETAASYFSMQLTEEIKEYLVKRGIDEDTRKQFFLGYAPGKGHLINYFENKSVPEDILLKSGLVGRKEDGRMYEVFSQRIMFPIRNIYNKIVGFGGRVLGDALPKYINSPETLIFKKSETMYGENIAISASYKKNYSIVVEGYMDVIALNQIGFNEAVASLGTSVTEKHLQKLWRSGDEIIVCLDGDSAGQRAASRLIEIALPMITADKKLSFINLPDGKDPDEIAKAGGADLFNKLIAGRIDLSNSIWQNEFNGKVFSSAESRAELEKNLKEYCKKIRDTSLSTNFYRYFKEQIWQNLYKKSTKGEFAKKVNKTYIVSSEEEKYTKLELSELSVCSFILRFPDILKNNEIKETLSALFFSDIKINEFKEWLITQAEEQEELETLGEKEIEALAKKDGFYDSYLLLSDPEKMFLDTVYINKNRDNRERLFELLNKRRYLESLKHECANIMSKLNESAQAQTVSYLKEIQKTSLEVEKLEEFFTS